jgi:DNA primase
VEEDDKPVLRPLSAAEKEAVEGTVAYYQQQMTVDGVRYLTERGISRETAAQFRLGMIGGDLVRPGDEYQAGSIVIPYLDRNGGALTYRTRCIQDHDHRALRHGKYKSRKADPPRLFNVAGVHKASDVLEVTEGEFDAMILTQLGLHAIAVPGAEHWQPHHSRVVAGFNRVRMWADADEAGMDLLRKITRTVRNAQGIYLPPKQDVSSLYLSGGVDAVLDLIGEDE